MTDATNPDTLQLPVLFLLLGQRFIVDSYVFGKVIYDKIQYNNQKITRMMPDPLDALYALGNDDAAPLLKNELETFHYAPNLQNIRYLLDSHDQGFWRATLYNSWLNTLKTLNPSEYPDYQKQPLFMRSAAWHQEKLNTQLASWAQLHHDNLLYAKQSYTPGISCSYPHGYVEPYPAFYKEIGHFARKASSLLGSISTLNTMAAYYNRVAALMDTLESIAQKELSREPFSVRDSIFIANMLVVDNVCGAPVTSGWFAYLIYDNSLTSTGDYTIADVHTQPTDASRQLVGNILHTGVGKVEPRCISCRIPICRFQTYGLCRSSHFILSKNYKSI